MTKAPRPTPDISRSASCSPGISVLLTERADLFAGRRIGVLTNASGVLPDLTSSADALLRAADVRALFAPEHGLYGAAAEGAEVGHEVHRSGMPIYSLYGAHLAPLPEQLAGLNAIVCDIQDVGCRFYTYAWTLIKLMEVAAQVGVAVIVADRPNPLGGLLIEGPEVEPAYRTLVGLHDAPIRHGLTLGELARLVNTETALGCDLTVVPCTGWRRADLWAATGLPWIPPSPNMPTADTVQVYPGACLLEGTNVSVGRGTARPFEWLGAPWIDGVALAEALNAQDLPGVRWRAVTFQPYAAPYAGELCAGVQIHVTDPAVFSPVLAGVTLLVLLNQLHHDRFAWHGDHFDRLAGSDRLRQAVADGVPPATIAATWGDNEQAFRQRVAPALLYE